MNFSLSLFFSFSLFSFSNASLLLNASYLHSLEKVEEDRVKSFLIQKGVLYIQSQMIEMAKNGYSTYSIQDCDDTRYFQLPSFIDDANITPKNYAYLKEEVISSISQELRASCEDCIQHQKRVNDCVIYSISW